jgi:hypothetical protein
MAPIAVVVLLPATLILEPNVLGITVALARKDVLILFLLIVNFAMALRICAMEGSVSYPEHILNVRDSEFWMREDTGFHLA